MLERCAVVADIASPKKTSTHSSILGRLTSSRRPSEVAGHSVVGKAARTVPFTIETSDNDQGVHTPDAQTVR